MLLHGLTENLKRYTFSNRPGMDGDQACNPLTISKAATIPKASHNSRLLKKLSADKGAV
jgi:hypothetical protein